MNSTREEVPSRLALMKPDEERAEFLDRECREYVALRARLDAMVAAP